MTTDLSSVMEVFWETVSLRVNAPSPSVTFGTHHSVSSVDHSVSSTVHAELPVIESSTSPPVASTLQSTGERPRVSLTSGLSSGVHDTARSRAALAKSKIFFIMTVDWLLCICEIINNSDSGSVLDCCHSPFEAEEAFRVFRVRNEYNPRLWKPSRQQFPP